MTLNTVKTATDFTGIKPGVISTSMLNPEVLESFKDMADSRRKAAIRAFQDEFPEQLRWSIVHWFYGPTWAEQYAAGTPDMRKAGEVMHELDEELKCCEFEHIVDSIIEQIDSDPSPFVPAEEVYTYIGGCISADGNGGSMLDPDGVMCNEDRLEVTIIGDMVHVTCSPYIAQRNTAPTYAPDGCLDISDTVFPSELCYTLPPWAFVGQPEEAQLKSHTFHVTDHDAMVARLDKYLLHVAKMEASRAFTEDDV